MNLLSPKVVLMVTTAVIIMGIQMTTAMNMLTIMRISMTTVMCMARTASTTTDEHQQ